MLSTSPLRSYLLSLPLSSLLFSFLPLTVYLFRYKWISILVMISPVLCLCSPVYLCYFIFSKYCAVSQLLSVSSSVTSHFISLSLSPSFLSSPSLSLYWSVFECCFCIPAQVAYFNGSNINRCYPICESRDRGRLLGILTADSKSRSRLAWALSPKWRAQICYISSEKMPRERCSTSKMWSNPPPRLFLSQISSSFELYRSA